MKWVDAATAPDQMTAEMWCDILRKEGVPAFPKLAGAALHVNILFGPAVPSGCLVMVPEERLEEARAILDSLDIDVDCEEGEEEA